MTMASDEFVAVASRIHRHLPSGVHQTPSSARLRVLVVDPLESTGERSAAVFTELGCDVVRTQTAAGAAR